MPKATAPTMSPEILTALYTGRFGQYEGNVADLYAAASTVLGRPITAEDRSMAVMGEISTAVQDDYWTMTDPDAWQARKDLTAAAQADQAALIIENVQVNGPMVVRGDEAEPVAEAAE